MTLHKAEPASEFVQDSASVCVHCHRDIKRVPGGHGPTWVHVHSGAVVGGREHKFSCDVTLYGSSATCNCGAEGEE